MTILPNGIEVEGLVREFKGGVRAVDGIDLRVEPGEIFGFLGPNGAGKSTTVLMLTTLLPPTAGSARVAGPDIVREGPAFSNTSSAHGFLSSSPTCPATQSVSASATQAWRSDERLISRNHRARWRHRKVQRCTVGYRRGLAGRRGSGTTPHGSGPLSTPDDGAAGSEYQCTGGARLRDSCSASMAAMA